MISRRIVSLLLLPILILVQLFVTAYADDAQELVADYISLNLTEYQNGIVNRLDSGVVENTFFDGRSAVKITPNPDCTTTKALALDGYSYVSAGIDLKYYSAVAIEYYYDSDTPLKVNGLITIQTNGKVLTRGLDFYSNDKLVGKKWDLMLFDISDVKEYLNPDTTDHAMRQMHIRPFSLTIPSKLSKNEPIYFGKIIFFKTMPNINYKNAYLEGYDDGTFKPSNPLSRAEACAIVARLTENDINISGTPTFKDVDKDEWYARYIGFLEEKGMLDGFGKSFMPNAPISRYDFSRLVSMALSLTQDKALPSSDIGKGFAEAKSTGPVSRAQAASIINNLTGYIPDNSSVLRDAPILFLDIDGTNPYYADIATATLDHATLLGNWYFPFQNSIDILAEKIGYGFLYNTSEGYKKVGELDELEQARILEIQSTNKIPEHYGKTYYVSADGDDSNSGLSPDTPKKTIAAANALARAYDAVLMRRGDTFRERIATQAYVTYSAYGYGNKPRIYGSPENGANPRMWKLVYENKETGALIWQYNQDNFLDVGTMVFDDGEGFAIKELPSCKGAQFVNRSDPSIPYDYTVELDKNLEFFHAANSALTNSAASGDYINAGKATGPLYLRCDNGNPGKVFSSIEFNTKNNVIQAANGVTIDNLCIMYGGSHGIGSGSVKDLTVTNCEIGWIGGSIQSYNANGNTNNSATRFGNGVEVYGSCDGYTIDNCYVYQCYDAGVTHQFSSLTNGDCIMNNVTYSNNVITECVYSIEYFLGTVEGYDRGGDNILFEGNLMRRAGYGFGSVRPDGNNQRHIRSSNRDNPFTNYRIINNVFDRSVYQLIFANTTFPECVPEMEGNIYIQGINNKLYHVGQKSAISDYNAISKIKNILGDETGHMYFVDTIPYYKYDYEPPRTVEVTSSDRTSFLFTVAQSRHKTKTPYSLSKSA